MHYPEVLWFGEVQLFTKQQDLDQPKFKAKMVSEFADNKIYVTDKLNFVLGRVENIVGKEQNAD